jgi:hypothetical protein
VSGRLTLGALVAVIAAYRETVQPWNELIDNYQQLEDNRVKYARRWSRTSCRRASALPGGGGRQPRAVDRGRWRRQASVWRTTIRACSTTSLCRGQCRARSPSSAPPRSGIRAGAGVCRPAAADRRIGQGGRARYRGLSAEEIGHCFSYAGRASHIFSGGWRTNIVCASGTGE